MKLTDIYWAAGIIEGEGCIISGVDQKKKSKYARLAVEMCDLDILKRLQAILGPYAHLRERTETQLRPHWRTRYILQICGPALASWLMTLYPLLGERRKKAALAALTTWKAMKHSSNIRGTRPLSPQV